VYFDASRCRHYGECVQGLPEVFDVAARPWVNPDGAAPGAVAEVVERCPSGALHYRFDEGPVEAPARPTTITDTAAGPILVRGELRLVADGVEMAETRAALCGCGASANRPFCDGACVTPAGPG